ncbi:MAG: nucleoside deaminase [Proteobacteria bacterium]|nr:nucleoside deaminase [Pseudomonadota bacterium]
MMNIDSIMKRTLELAKIAFQEDEVPVGAVIFDDEGRIIAESENKTRRGKSVTKHAELCVIEKVGQIAGSENLSKLNIATSLEPCTMCAQAIAWSKLKAVFIACKDEKSGGVYYNAEVFKHSHNKPEVVYLEEYEKESAELMRSFFRGKR